MFPNPDHGPAGVPQNLVDPSIPSHVVSDLVGPEPLIALRAGRMLRTAVPEAAIDVDCHAHSRKDDIRSRSDPGDGFCVLAIAKAARMNSPPDGELRSSVPLSNTPHPPQSFWSRWRDPVFVGGHGTSIREEDFSSRLCR